MERENVTVTYSEKINMDSLNEPLTKIIFNSLDIIIDGVIKSENPKRLDIDIHVEDEYGNDLPNSILFGIIEKEFEDNKTKTGLDYCMIWKMNEFIIVAGVKR